MNPIKPFSKHVSGYFDLSYFAKFLVLLLSLYYFNKMFWGLTDPKNFYVPFFDKYFNYISWLTTSILKAASLIDSVFGVKASITGNNIFVPQGASVLLSYECLGFGIMSFWIAFIVADRSNLKRKALWCFAGVALIWVINCWRIAILMLALQNKWPQSKHIDHHDMFNVAAYLLILLLIYLYNREDNRIKFSATTVAGPVSYCAVV
jgi:exosortase/archaeosortase family protein